MSLTIAQNCFLGAYLEILTTPLARRRVFSEEPIWPSGIPNHRSIDCANSPWSK